MSRLADTQRAIRDAMVSGETGAGLPLLLGGRDPARRLAIHHRHYRASLVGTLLTRFPALTWLVGGPVIADAATGFVRAHPPIAPCLAEYGDAFPAFLASRLGRTDTPYVQPFGKLEWHVGAVSIAVDVPATALDAYAADAHRLARATATLQPGLRYLRAEWPVHDLMTRFLTDTAPDVYELRRETIWLQVRGARGAFAIDALDAATWTFRDDLQRGLSLEAAAAHAVEMDDTFDPGAALTTLVTARLLVDLTFPAKRIPR